MNVKTRRNFLGDVGRGMLVAGVGPLVANELGISTAFADNSPSQLDFGQLRPLVAIMQETPPAKLQPLLVRKLKKGEVNLRQLIAAASLANAETFGGDDYVGFHTEMALLPAYNMSQRLPKARQPLPVLKVLYRNADRIQQMGAKHRTLHPLNSTSANDATGETLLKASRAGNMKKAEVLFAKMTEGSLEDAYNNLQYIVQDNMNVHRFVLAHRARSLVDFVGQEHAHTLLRQSVRFCVNSYSHPNANQTPIREQLLKALNDHHLLDKQFGTRQPDDGWVEEMIQTIYTGGKERAINAVAAAIAEGFSQEAIGEAISLAANQLVLRQGTGRTHGDARGVHGSDAVNAWRNMVRVVEPKNGMIGMLVATYHTADYAMDKAIQGIPYPRDEHLHSIKSETPESLLKEAEGAIRENNQSRAAAAIHVYGQKGHAAKPVFDLMLRYAITEDGRLHGEKYLQTVIEEFQTTRPTFRWRQLVSLARVTASAYGYDREDKATGRAPGYEEACKLLGVS